MIYHILKNNITHKTYRIFRHRLKYSAYITHYQKENNRDQPPSLRSQNTLGPSPTKRQTNEIKR